MFDHLEVADTDAALARAAGAGGSPGTAADFVYGRMATITDPSAPSSR